MGQERRRTFVDGWQPGQGALDKTPNSSDC